MPLINPAKLKGIIKRPGGTDKRSAIPSTTGMKIATTPVELITEPRPAAASIKRTTSRVSFPPALVTSRSPNLEAIPVRTSPSPITNKAAIRMMFGSLKPAKASGTLVRPHNGRTTIARRATTSMRGLLKTNIPTQARRSPTTKSNSGFIEALGGSSFAIS